MDGKGGRVRGAPVIPETDEQKRRYEDAGRRREIAAGGVGAPAQRPALTFLTHPLCCDHRHIPWVASRGILVVLAQFNKTLTMDSALLIHRLHFAFTITFHYLFPQLTMGLALLIVMLKTLALRTGRRAL